ncbi:MAG: rod shape-determining protein RodA [candidate division Zixibacteria bacterium]|nr:rod shape-determining protein RodA [candidate division Zixibacteria bacterium]
MKSILSIDPLVFIPALLLSIIGIIGIYSTGLNEDYTIYQGMYIKQAIWAGVGILLFIVIQFIPLRIHEMFAYIYYFIALILLIAVLWFGNAGSTKAVRWFDLGVFHLQPSELAKLAVVFALARFFTYYRRKFPDTGSILFVLVLGFIPFALVVKQPDLGTALVFSVITMFMLYWAGLTFFQLFLFISPFVSMTAASHPIPWAIFMVLLLGLLIIIRTDIKISIGVYLINIGFGVLTPVLWSKLHDYQKMRILTFLDPGRDPRGAGYQIIQSKIAIGSGGLWGTGIGEGTQTKLAFLPTQHTDFIFSVIGEEFGFIGGALILILFLVLLIRSISIAAKTRKGFLGLATGGIVIIILFQALVNIGMAIGLMPVTGLPLPFVSYGGTSMLVFWIIIGLVNAVNRDWRYY